MLVIGDVHGKVNEYWKIVQKNKGNKSIQCGDFGFKTQHDWFLQNIDFNLNKICFGNHDYFPYLNMPHSCGNFQFFEDQSIFTVRGAYSIDQYHRTEGRDWFSNEELNYSEFHDLIDYYLEVKPNVVISHDAPHSIRQTLFGITDKSTTSNGLQAMFENHQPDLWIFGHHHQSKDVNINRTRFICLKELETFLI